MKRENKNLSNNIIDAITVLERLRNDKVRITFIHNNSIDRSYNVGKIISDDYYKVLGLTEMVAELLIHKAITDEIAILESKLELL